MDKTEPCKCGSKTFWRKMVRTQVTPMKSTLTAGPWVCQACHPPVDRADVIAMLSLEDWSKVSDKDRKLLKKFGWGKGGRK